ncbi:hypothetical protein [Castellaniella sp. UC4442_H9]
MADSYEKLRAAQQSIGVPDWQWWDSNSFRRLTFVEANGRHGQDGGALCAVVQSDGHPDVHMAPGVRGFIEACSPTTVRALLVDLDESDRALVLVGKANKKLLDEFVELKAERDKLRAACEKAAEWLEGWASAEPYLSELRAALAQEGS